MEAQERIQREQQANVKSINELKMDDYTDKIIEQIKPKSKFSLIPDSPFKTIIGIIEPELMYETSRKWKEKFKQNYSHQVI